MRHPSGGQPCSTTRIHMRHLFLTRSCSLASSCHEGQRRKMARLALCLSLFVTGCDANSTFTWRQTSLIAPRDLPPKQDVQVWTHGIPLYWQKVTISHDSVSGVPTTSKNWGLFVSYTEADRNGCK